MIDLVYAEHDWILYLAAFACAFGIALVATPYAKKLAYKFNAVKHPRARDMHSKPMPQMGGVAIVLGFIITVAIMAIFMPYFRDIEFLGLAIGGIIIAGLGIADDILELRSITKLIVQIIVAVIVVASGIRMEIVVWPITAYLQPFSIPITILWIVGMTNAVNFIDGLDGLAAGVSAIGAICLMVLCILSGSPLAVVLSAILAGSILGFLPRNFNPAEIFMGDTGALFIGYVLAVSSILGVFKGYTLLAILIIFFALSLPIFDTLFAFCRRLYKSRKLSSTMVADKGHIHHRLIDAGFSTKQSVFIMYAVSAVTAVIAVVIAMQDFHVIIITAISLAAMVIALRVYSKRTSKANEEQKNQPEQIDQADEIEQVSSEEI